MAVNGFHWAGVSAGIKKNDIPDLALLVSDVPAQVAGVFTTNQVKAACVDWDQAIVRGGGMVRAVVINSGNANAVTGPQGEANNRKMAEHTAGLIGCAAEEVLVLSTGVIGVQLPIDKVLSGIDAAYAALDAASMPEAAQAIRTTDTRPKTHIDEQDGYTLAGVAKGSGMIAPNMATMLGILATDADISGDALGATFTACMEETFNRIVVDGDMSTNDTVLLLANGASGTTIQAEALTNPLYTVSRSLAMQIVRDGEGATKFVTINVMGARSDVDANQIAQAIARSPLCKTAFHGSDPNWGRILAAAGYAGVAFDPDAVSLHIVPSVDGDPAPLDQGVHLLHRGQPTDYTEEAASSIMLADEFGIILDIASGTGNATVWTCDLSHDYVTINADYRT